MLAVVEDDLEHPARVRDLVLDSGRIEEPRTPSGVVEQWRAVAVQDPLEIAVGSPAIVVSRSTVPLVRGTEVHAGAVLLAVAVQDSVAAVVAGLADEPREDPARLERIGDAGTAGEPVDGQDVVP